MSDAQKAAERLGTKFAKCAQCGETFVCDPNETFCVMWNQPGGDYDDGNSEVEFCCSHLCASRKLATLTGIIWRGGRCGGTLMPSLGEPP